MKRAATIGVAVTLLASGCTSPAPQDVLAGLEPPVACAEQPREHRDGGVWACLAGDAGLSIQDEPDNLDVYFAVGLDSGLISLWHEQQGWVAATSDAQVAEQVADQTDAIIVDQATFRDRFLD